MFCSNCGKEIADKAVICVHCGVPTNNSVTERNSTSDKNWCVAFLLVFFFGLLGAHRFYTGHIGSAVAQLILTLTFFGILISGIWVFIDFIIILTGNFRTADGEKLKY